MVRTSPRDTRRGGIGPRHPLTRPTTGRPRPARLPNGGLRNRCAGRWTDEDRVALAVRHRDRLRDSGSVISSKASASNATSPRRPAASLSCRGPPLDVDRPRTTAAEIDAEVSAMIAAGESIYSLDHARIRAIDPDVILAQDLCAVCAVPSGQVQEALGVIGCHADVVSLDPAGLDDVIECVAQVGRATGTERVAAELTAAPVGASKTCAPAWPTARARGSSSSNGPTHRSTGAIGCSEMVAGGGVASRSSPQFEDTVAPPDVGGGRARVDRRHDLQPLWVRPRRRRRPSRLVHRPPGPPGPRTRSSRKSTPTPTSPGRVPVWHRRRRAAGRAPRCIPTRPGAPVVPGRRSLR